MRDMASGQDNHHNNNNNIHDSPITTSSTSPMVTTTGTTTSSTATGRRLLSRIASPFSPKPRSLSEYYIRPDEPHRQYAPGDTLRGAVVLTVVKPVRITHLVVCLRGHARVFKNGSNEATYASDTYSTSGQGKRSGEYYGNGFASLFRDEVVLSGDGRLEAGVYEFNFELEFPEKGLPSSIDFERGTISYTITSTLTRPTTISPTSSCDRKVQLVEVVDIGPMQQPRSQTITLEPIRRSHRSREKAKAINRPELLGGNSQPVSSSSLPRLTGPGAAGQDAARQSNSDEPSEEPGSPAASEGSGSVSVTSESLSSLRAVPSPSISRSGSPVINSSILNKTITTSVEISRTGCLRGDTIPLKVHVTHTKPIKSLHGVIVTLYRQGRIDSHAVASPSRAGKRGDDAHEDYYPKSRTGLGGLSLSSAGSSSTFRKDLSQTFAPIIVNPRTLMADVKASVKVPEDAFPTICSVPGSIITFRYYLEVVIDLNGKLRELQSNLPRPGTVNTPSTYWRLDNQEENPTDEGMATVLAALGGSIIDTDQVRREKSVVACVFEILVGTKDSTRGRSGRLADARRSGADASGEARADEASIDQVIRPEGPREVEGMPPYRGPENVPDYMVSQREQGPAHHRVDIPPPEMENAQEGDEKAMARNAEQRLLPSAPPGVEDVNREYRHVAPSAPAVSEFGPVASSSQGWANPGTPYVSAPSADAVRHTADPAEGSWSSRVPEPVTEDKHELELRRLQAQASAPDDDGPSADEVPEESAHAPPPPVLPSAPVITEADENGQYGGYESHVAAGTVSGGEGLPKYER